MAKSNLLPTIFICIALITATIAIYWQVGNHEFLSYDDDLYITRNAHVANGLTKASVVWAFTSVEQCNWHPVTWLSHMLDVQLFGMNPYGHHVANVVMHAIASLLLFSLFFKLTGKLWQSIFVAAMFALHPLNVESVAWAAERKNVLSICFCFLTLLLYSHYAEKHDSAVAQGALYLLTLCSFILGLMTKPVLVTVPVVMLLLDFWPLQRFITGKKNVMTENDNSTIDRCHHFATAATCRISLFHLAMEKIPFFVCSALSSAITIYAQHNGRAIVTLEWVPFINRVQNALVSYLKYIIKTVYPHDLAVLYPFFLAIPLWQVICAAVVLLLVTSAVLWGGQRHPYLAVGWFWFIITLLPVIGLIQVGNQAMADRYAYLPTIGLFIMAAWGVPAFFREKYGFQRIARLLRLSLLTSEKRSQMALALLAAGVVLAYSATTWQQIRYWQNNFTLYQHALDVTTGNYIINYNLGIAYGRSGNAAAAINEFRAALMIKPNDGKTRNLLASTLAEQGDIDAAIREFINTLLINPNNSEAKNSLEFWQQQKRK